MRKKREENKGGEEKRTRKRRGAGEYAQCACSDPTHLLLQCNVVLVELNHFIWRIKTNRPLIHIIINHSAVVHRAEGQQEQFTEAYSIFKQETLRLCH